MDMAAAGTDVEAGTAAATAGCPVPRKRRVDMAEKETDTETETETDIGITAGTAVWRMKARVWRGAVGTAATMEAAAAAAEGRMRRNGTVEAMATMEEDGLRLRAMAGMATMEAAMEEAGLRRRATATMAGAMEEAGLRLRHHSHPLQKQK